MGVTRLKRKDRRNKNVSQMKVQFRSLGTNIEIGSRSVMPSKSQIVKNNVVLDKVSAELKK